VTDPLDRPIDIPDPVDPGDRPLTRRQARRSLLACGAVLGVVLAILIGVAGWQFVQLGQAADALCAFRGDLQLRQDQAEEFLAKHPEGLPDLATPEQIQRDIDARARTIESLSGLNCPAATLGASATPRATPTP
jgi:hypothetical protein